jgi:hypothetical protein
MDVKEITAQCCLEWMSQLSGFRKKWSAHTSYRVQVLVNEKDVRVKVFDRDGCSFTVICFPEEYQYVDLIQRMLGQGKYLGKTGDFKIWVPVDTFDSDSHRMISWRIVSSLLCFAQVAGKTNFRALKELDSEFHDDFLVGLSNHSLTNTFFQ